MVSSDKMLKLMKQEYNECVTECKQILEHLENKVQHKLYEDAIGSEQAALMDLLDVKDSSSNMLVSRHDHLNMNRLNSMTMSHFEQNFVQEINEAVT